MSIELLSTQQDIYKYLSDIGVDKGGMAILANKAKLHWIALRGLHVGAANILKQDALSIGADLAVPRGTVIGAQKEVDTLLIASNKHLQILAKKELSQPFGLAKLAPFFQKIAHLKKPQNLEVMGIINANDDSFFAQSRFMAAEAIDAIEKMITQGATIIDIGAVSSRPNAPLVSKQEELARVHPLLEAIAKHKLYESVTFSIDSYTPEVVHLALESGFTMVNDITGFRDDTLCRLCGEYQASAVIMHMQGTPQTMQNNPHYDNILKEMSDFFQQRIEKVSSFGVKDIILDVGIGFGKSVEDNIFLLQNLEHFLLFEKRLLVGASRKSMIDKIFPSTVEDRLSGTLALHLEALRNGASILRVHDVYEHVQALAIYQALHS